jgi:hypothetical protein
VRSIACMLIAMFPYREQGGESRVDFGMAIGPGWAGIALDLPIIKSRSSRGSPAREIEHGR